MSKPCRSNSRRGEAFHVNVLDIVLDKKLPNSTKTLNLILRVYFIIKIIKTLIKSRTEEYGSTLFAFTVQKAGSFLMSESAYESFY